ncbi:MAG: hypothetical protein M3300_08460 [Actinomycetota bacterium]|nr:hypothetical protein [Actinomycetota bacterium]
MHGVYHLKTAVEVPRGSPVTAAVLMFATIRAHCSRRLHHDRVVGTRWVGERAINLTAADGDGRAEQLPVGIPSERVQRRRTTVQHLLDTVLEPEVVAERIFAAVEANRLYELTHGDVGEEARHRAEGVLAALGHYVN